MCFIVTIIIFKTYLRGESFYVKIDEFALTSVIRRKKTKDQPGPSVTSLKKDVEKSAGSFEYSKEMGVLHTFSRKNSSRNYTIPEH